MAAHKKPRLDRDRPFATVHGDRKVAFEQDGIEFDSRGIGIIKPVPHLPNQTERRKLRALSTVDLMRTVEAAGGTYVTRFRALKWLCAQIIVPPGASPPAETAAAS